MRCFDWWFRGSCENCGLSTDVLRVLYACCSSSFFLVCFAELLRKMTLREFFEALRPNLALQMATMRLSRQNIRLFPRKNGCSLENYGRRSKKPVTPSKPAESRPTQKGFMFLPPGIDSGTNMHQQTCSSCWLGHSDLSVLFGASFQSVKIRRQKRKNHCLEQVRPSLGELWPC